MGSLSIHCCGRRDGRGLPRGHQEPWWGWELGGSPGEEESYREVSLVDPQEKDQLGQAQGSCEVASDAMLVGAKGTKKGEEEEGDCQGSQGDSKGHVCQGFQWQDLTILRDEW